MSDWLSLSTQQPKSYQVVLVYDGEDVLVAHHTKFGLIDATNSEYPDNIFGATHWMPLPAPPKELS